MTQHRLEEEFLSVYRRLDCQQKTIVRHMLINEIAKRSKKPPTPTLASRPTFAPGRILFCGLLTICLFPVLPNTPMALPIVVGSGAAAAVIYELAERPFFKVKNVLLIILYRTKNEN